MRILFAGGGTGGHLFPGLALADELRRQCPDAVIEFIGAEDGLERAIVPAAGYALHCLASRRGSPFSLRQPRNFPCFLRAVWQGWRLLRSPLPAAAVVSLGGYAAAAPGMAAALAGVPLVVMEQNAIPGKTTRFLARWAQEIYLQFAEAKSYFAHSRAALFACGSPLRPEIAHLYTEQSAAPRLLLIMGGSQGARRLNQLAAAALPFLHQAGCRPIALIAGVNHEAEMRQAAMPWADEAAVFGFCRDMAALYAEARLTVARAGALSLAELAAAGVPAILLPFPSAADDHQRANARVFVASGAAIAWEEDCLTPEAFAAGIAALWQDEARLKQMRAAMRRLAKPNAAAFIAQRILPMCGVR